MQISVHRLGESGTWTPPLDATLDSARTLVLAFGHARHLDEPAPLRELRERFPLAVLAGCSTAGQILDRTIADDALVVAVVRFALTDLSVSHEDVRGPEDSRAAGRRLATALDRPDLRAVFVLSDGLLVNGSELVHGLDDAFGRPVIVTGGLAGDGDRFQRTWVARDGEPKAACIVAVGLYGDHVRVGHGSRGGWDKFGPERRVTRSTGNVVHEIDGSPALELYRRYLGERASGLPATGLLFPLALRRDAEDPNSVVRTLLAVNEETQSMTFAGDVPQGWLVQLMRANFDRLIAGAADAAQLTRRPGAPDEGAVLSIAISCVGRRLVLGERVEEELEATLEGSPAATRQVGFYSYGEISPQSNGRCDLHNQTMTLTTFREDLPRAA